MGLTVSIETPEAVRIPHADTAKVALIYPVLESMSSFSSCQADLSVSTVPLFFAAIHSRPPFC